MSWVLTGLSCKKDPSLPSLLGPCFSLSRVEAPWPSLLVLTQRCHILLQRLIAEKGNVDSQMQKYQLDKPKSDNNGIKADYWDIKPASECNYYFQQLVDVQVGYLHKKTFKTFGTTKTLFDCNLSAGRGPILPHAIQFSHFPSLSLFLGLFMFTCLGTWPMKWIINFFKRRGG